MDKPRVLLIQSLGSSLAPVRKLLEERNFLVHLSRTWEEAERTYSAFPSGQIKFIFTDVTLCQGSGWEKFVQRARNTPSDATLICFHPQFSNSLYDLLQHPYSTTDAELSTEEREIEEALIIGETRQFRDVLDLASRYASHDITVLITGETGTGKEVVARYIHNQSSRKDKSFIPCNMTAIPETLVESELFGYLKGAFTGADKNKKGLIEAAEGGTLFLDEIGDLPPTIQLKLLRFLESREFYKVGDSAAKFADVRIIAATNRDLDKAILENGFRKDLYYRLNSARIILPPLRERREDIILLVANFVYQTCRHTQMPIKKISNSVKVLLLDYPWPGNIRELKNVIESAVMVSDDEYLTLSDLPMHLQQYATSHRDEIGAKAIRSISEAERDIIEQALKEANGNKGKAAELLGISTRTLYRKIVKFSGQVSPDTAPEL
jgi:transcriptional regulator with PAS, ATPase and Fis domain